MSSGVERKMADDPASEHGELKQGVLSATSLTAASDTHSSATTRRKKVAEDDDAGMEHVRDSLPYSLSYDEIERRFGVGTRVYWHFLTFVIVTNAILAVVMGASYLQYLGGDRSESIRRVHCFEVSAEFFLRPALNETTNTETLELLLNPDIASQSLSRRDPDDTSLSISELFISSYTYLNNRTIWIVCSAIAVILTHVFPFAFYQYIKKYVLGNRQNEYDNPFAFSGLENEQIPQNDRYTELNRTLRIFVVVGVYIGMLIISFVIIVAIETLNREYRDNPDFRVQGISVLDLAVTLVVTGINMFFTQIARLLTLFEKQLTWAAHRRSHTLKLYTFKILNVVAMYSAVGVVSVNSACPYYDSGRKFLVLILTDLFIQNGIEILMPQIKMRLLPRLSTRFRGQGSDEEMKPDFDLAEEYLELFYRQFVIYVGMTLFPLLPLFGFFVNLVEYPIDKVRLTKICKRPKRVDISLKRLLSILLLCNAVIALLFPPLGTIWTLRGKVGVYEAHPDICPVFEGDGSGRPVMLPANDTDAAVVQPMYEPICLSINPINKARLSPDKNCTYIDNFQDLEEPCPRFVRSLYVEPYEPNFFLFAEQGNTSISTPKCVETTARCILGNENSIAREKKLDLLQLWKDHLAGNTPSSTSNSDNNNNNNNNSNVPAAAPAPALAPGSVQV